MVEEAVCLMMAGKQRTERGMGVCGEKVHHGGGHREGSYLFHGGKK
jgi:hypothetical protein